MITQLIKVLVSVALIVISIFDVDNWLYKRKSLMNPGTYTKITNNIKQALQQKKQVEQF